MIIASRVSVPSCSGVCFLKQRSKWFVGVESLFNAIPDWMHFQKWWDNKHIAHWFLISHFLALFFLSGLGKKLKLNNILRFSIEYPLKSQRQFNSAISNRNIYNSLIHAEYSMYTQCLNKRVFFSYGIWLYVSDWQD